MTARHDQEPFNGTKELPGQSLLAAQIASYISSRADFLAIQEAPLEGKPSQLPSGMNNRSTRLGEAGGKTSTASRERGRRNR
ncbi:hypothetical protein F3Y22_tig00110258pilonHSYRG00011 [Hibiscus syriacus]|uniref:Uncharacterized protein n=1 Tax=Hibiscus syriacus TaxID=106335 RepID=A0A6A3B972_HIBSY|nr:hypothetical protein F3Y22_tig00110258pilonHSYRG00011 [Hibiscus syriacus]